MSTPAGVLKCASSAQPSSDCHEAALRPEDVEAATKFHSSEIERLLQIRVRRGCCSRAWIFEAFSRALSTAFRRPTAFNRLKSTRSCSKREPVAIQFNWSFNCSLTTAARRRSCATRSSCLCASPCSVRCRRYRPPPRRLRRDKTRLFPSRTAFAVPDGRYVSQCS